MGLRPALLAGLLAGPAAGETLRIASYDPDLSRRGPGLLLRDIAGGTDPQVLAAVRVIAALDADILLLTGIDWDYDLAALHALAGLLSQAGVDYPHLIAPRPNRGLPSGADLNANGRLNEPGDAQGWGRFTGEDGMAVLSRLPVGAVTDYSDKLWRDMPGNLIGDALTPEAAAVQRLSTTGHWDIEILTDPPLHLLAFAATAPVFDGPEDRNGRRNHDEIAFWLHHLPDQPFVLAGKFNLDPVDGEGLHQAIAAIQAHPRITDPAPVSPGAAAAPDPGQAGDPAFDTVDWPDGRPGNLRVTYVLPSAGLELRGTGVLWPLAGDDDDDDLAGALEAASVHRPVWIEIARPRAIP